MKDNLQTISSEVFQYSLVFYLGLLIAETIKKGLVSEVFNLNILLGVVLVSGIIKVLTYDPDVENIGTYKGLIAFFRNPTLPKKHITSNDKTYIFVISFAGAALVYYKTQELGGISLILTLLTFIIIMLLSYLIYTEEE